jgi:hypothetical protein
MAGTMRFIVVYDVTPRSLVDIYWRFRGSKRSMFGLIFHPENGFSRFIQDIGKYLPDYKE